MRKKIAVIVMVTSFILLTGFIGGVDRDTLTLTQGFTGAGVSTVIFFISALIGGVIDE